MPVRYTIHILRLTFGSDAQSGAARFPGLPMTAAPPPVAHKRKCRPDVLNLVFRRGIWLGGKKCRALPPQDVYVQFGSNDQISLTAINQKLTDEIHQLDGKGAGDLKTQFMVHNNDGAPLVTDLANSKIKFFITSDFIHVFQQNVHLF